MFAIVQITFNHNMSEEELESGALDWAKHVKPTISGLKWKMFLNDTGSKESCGIYLFDDLESAKAYAESELRGEKNTAKIIECLLTE